MALERGHNLLVLTNAMRPMMRPRIKTELLNLNIRYPERLTLRVSLDHFTPLEHDRERGSGSFEIAVKGLNWLTENNFNVHIAGRADFSESEASARTRAKRHNGTSTKHTSMSAILRRQCGW